MMEPDIPLLTHDGLDAYMKTVSATTDFRTLHDCGISATETNISSKLPCIETVPRYVKQNQNDMYTAELNMPSVQRFGTGNSTSGMTFGGDIADPASNITWPMVSCSPGDFSGMSGSVAAAASNNVAINMNKDLENNKVENCAMWVPLKPVMPKPTRFISPKSCELSYQYCQDSLSMLAHSRQLVKEATRKRELRLIKNRVAAKRCRQRKREYVNCLEERLSFLKQQNEQLVEEVKMVRASVLLGIKEMMR